MRTLAIAAALALSAAGSTAAMAQDATSATVADPAMAAPVQEEDHDFPWGLLGLIGLAGLLGRKRDDHRVDDVRRT